MLVQFAGMSLRGQTKQLLVLLTAEALQVRAHKMQHIPYPQDCPDRSTSIHTVATAALTDHIRLSLKELLHLTSKVILVDP